MERFEVYRNGKKLTNRQVRKYIRKELHISSKRYKKYYDIMRNKLRNYEKATGSKPQSVTQFLYNRAKYKAKARYEGFKYIKSSKAKLIESFSSRSSGKTSYGLREQANVNKLLDNYTKRVYNPLIKTNKYARRIYETIKDFKERLKALSEFATNRRDVVEQQNGTLTFQEDIIFGTMGQSSDGKEDEKIYNDIVTKYGGTSI